MSELIKISIRYDEDERGEWGWLVTPWYRRDGRLMSVPPAGGWPTYDEAVEYATDKIAEAGWKSYDAARDGDVLVLTPGGAK